MYTVIKADLENGRFTTSKCSVLLKADHLYDAMIANGLDDTCALFIINEVGDILRTNIEYDPQRDLPEDWEEDYDLEMGFDPYMGCYTDEC